MNTPRISQARARSVLFAGFAFVCLFSAVSSAQAQTRQRILLDSGWRFRLGDPADVTTNVTYYPEISDLAKLDANEVGAGNNTESYMESIRVDPIATDAGENVSFVLTNYDDSSWRQLDLPHDWAVELPFNQSADQGHGYKPVGNPAFTTNNIGWYRHTFTIPSAEAGQTLWLEFDGVYRNCLVWFNGHILGRNVSGYESFHFDVTPYANPGGTNVIVVRVDASRFEGWFYEGAGIYRHVWLTAANPVHVAEWGTYVATTSLVGSNATITVQTDVTNQSAQAANGSVTSTILDANSNAVANITSSLSVPAGQDMVTTQTVIITAKPWSLQTPYLYNLVTTISNQNAVADVYNTPFGVRTVAFDPTNGVFLNGQHVEIQGMCNHQDHAGVGIALPDRLQYFRIERLKQMGVNAYRTSHYEPTPELLNACDQLGMLVLDENRRLGTNAEPLGELNRQIRHDRNHPSVFCWSLANEEWDMQGSTTGAVIIASMQNLVHSLDTTRNCTAAINGSFGGTGFDTVLDVVGFNYSLGSLTYRSPNPNAGYIGTEQGATTGTRGVYADDLNDCYLADYDLVTVNPTVSGGVAWTSAAETWWPTFLANPWLSGGFDWTGFDYRGEPTPFTWPDIGSQFGIMDTCGFPKDSFYYYQANWSPKPVLHLLPHWNWPTPGQMVNVWAYGNCQIVELFLNGQSEGRQSVNVLGHVAWNVPYSPGTLQAIGYNYGVPVITNTMVTTGVPAAIALRPDRSTILADGHDVSVITVAALDVQGNVVPTASNTVSFAVSGGAILGVGNGNPSSHEADKATQRALFNGLAEVIVQSTNLPGSITLTASSAGLASTNVTITEAAALPAPPPPTGLAATVTGNAQVTVSWDVVPGAISYNLKRSTTGGGPYTDIADNVGALGYTDSNVTNGTTYYYVVSANGSGSGANSAAVSVTPGAIVQGLTAIVTNGQINLTWSGLPGTSYALKRAEATGGPYTVLTPGTAATNFTDTNVVFCQPYYYVVSVTNAGSAGLNSPEAIAELPGALPPQFTNADIGDVGFPGSGSYCGGQFTLTGSGSDIWNTADAFHFVYSYVPVCTNCDIRARVVSVQNTDPHAKAALMIRETLDPGSRHAMADVEPSAGLEFLYRTTPGGAGYFSTVSGQTAPNWIRLTRTNDNFRAYWSPDGNIWNQIGTETNIPMAGTSAYVGVAVCAHNNSVINTSVFDQVTASFLSNIPPVISLTAVATNNQIDLAWSSVPGASYGLKRSTISGGPYTLLASATAFTNYTDTNVVSCQPYYYVVTVTNAGNESLVSPEATAELPGALPPQFSSADIGAVGFPGSASFCGGQLTVTGSGSDIWDAADAFHFVYSYVPVCTNCDIRARVDSVQNTSANAKAAVMIRETLGPGSRHAMADVEPGAGLEFLFRTNTDGSSSYLNVPGQTAPNWVRLTRTNNLFSAYWSPDGNAWNQIGSSTNIPMAGTSAYVGLAVCAHNNSVLNTSVLDQISASFLSNVPPVLSWGLAPNDTVHFNWPADHIGWQLQVQTNALDIGLGTNWVDVPNSDLTNQLSVPIDPTKGSVFYRLQFNGL